MVFISWFFFCFVGGSLWLKVDCVFGLDFCDNALSCLPPCKSVLVANRKPFYTQQTIGDPFSWTSKDDRERERKSIDNSLPPSIFAHTLRKKETQTFPPLSQHRSTREILPPAKTLSPRRERTTPLPFCLDRMRSVSPPPKTHKGGRGTRRLCDVHSRFCRIKRPQKSISEFFLLFFFFLDCGRSERKRHCPLHTWDDFLQSFRVSRFSLVRFISFGKELIFLAKRIVKDAAIKHKQRRKRRGFLFNPENQVDGAKYIFFFFRKKENGSAQKSISWPKNQTFMGSEEKRLCRKKDFYPLSAVITQVSCGY